MSSTNFGPILIISSCLLVLVMYYVGDFFRNGRALSCCKKTMYFPTIMIGFGIFTLSGDFELDLTTYLFCKCISVAFRYCSIICMVDGLRIDGLVRVVVYLVVKCVGMFSLPGGGLIVLFCALKWRVFVYMHREYEDTPSLLQSSPS